MSMKSLNKAMAEYNRQLEKGTIRQAYRQLMEFMKGLRVYFYNTYPDHFVSGSIYQGFMDFTFLNFTPKKLRERKLKILVLFVHEDCSFNVWLCGANKKVQKKYWEWIKEQEWNRYIVPTSIEGKDYIIEHRLEENPDFDNLESLQDKIEKETLAFTQEVINFLAKVT